jgi:FlaA1/EpsC-like NDP-sugar epimerase
MLDNLIKKRAWFITVVQITIIVSSLALAFFLRFDGKIPSFYLPTLLSLFPAVLSIKMIIFWRMGLFKGWWRYVSMADLVAIFKANVFASLLFVLYVVFAHRLENIPRSVLALDFIFCFLLTGGIRFVTRAFRENYFPMPMRKSHENTRVLVVGAGDAGQMIAREIRQNPRLNLNVVGFVDDDRHKKGERFQGVPVLGGQDALASICHLHGIDEVIIAIPSASGQAIRQIVERCREAEVKFKTLPGVGDLIDGRVSVQHIKDVELDDLLGREPVRLDINKIQAYLTGKRVLVTGAAGSIGSEICRQVCRFNPSRLILFDNAETPLFHIHRELAERYPKVRQAAIIGDVRDHDRVDGIFDECLPQVVFHAAAYKHVPMMEHNPAEAANNNVRGTRIVAEAAHRVQVESFVMISTDKAVNPTNVMGASKRAAELFVQSLARNSHTNYITVRFGNVLGSAGSVVPIFKEQIARGGPVTVTHPDVTRFFMTIPEATQLVLQAGSMGQGGEIFLLDMGESVKIVTLAEELIRLSGLRPGEDIEIKFTGLRPGEKLYEELLVSGEGCKQTSHEKIMIAESKTVNRKWLLGKLEELYHLQRAIDQQGVINKLREIVPEFRPEMAGVQQGEQDTTAAVDSATLLKLVKP